MIDIIDPSLNQPLPTVATPVAPVEPIDPDSVNIEEQQLDDKQDRGLIKDEQHRRRRQKDTLELSSQEEDETAEESAEPADEVPGDDGSIDVLI